ncbi:LOW QUALITY PROTEIN: DEAD-box ATP-dependent RNA helicase 5 [Dioscorea cayenensis subsp. rotundata]|uniref:RNA helicase n=1 Tax=Dioscorea cayennensis subsp. rotundata TaxID=55577 RepID=A0AB40CUY2_DIOCR|nr:LOW QUALITY PROTEIN: DEAD-box ATP-dependent RNA helicase 5 [Dioscorea cayenensis subsp. rotundata]
MGRKLESTAGEEALEVANVNGFDDPENKIKKKKKKDKGNNLCESENGDDSKSKSKTKRKHKDSSEQSDGKILKEREKEGKKKKKDGVNELKEAGEGEKVEGGVVVTGNKTKDSKYKALNSFAESGLPAEVLDCCKSFSKPSPIQSHAWPFLLDGRDFIGIAATGSGKTVAFGVPALMHILQKKKKKTSTKVVPRCLVLSPTRELAQQIADVLCDAGSPCGLETVCLYGGTSKGPQISSLKSGVDIVIGTPGRMKDLIEMGICNLGDVSFVVLDEADRMLDMGFEPEVRSILSQTSSARQMVMFSATWPLAVHQLAQEFMDPDPVKVVIGSEDLAANHDVMQIVEVLDDRSRDARLVALLEKYHQSQRNRVLVFVLYKKEAARVETMLQRRGWKAVSVHGDKSQHDRTKALALFKEGKCPLMIATDVASRGLDIPDVEVVINYSFPLTTEDYVHRIGRTGRAGKKGVAHTFFTQENKALAGELVNVLREAGQVVPEALTKFGTHVKKKESKLYGSHFKEIKADAPKSTKITFANSDDEE